MHADTRGERSQGGGARGLTAVPCDAAALHVGMELLELVAALGQGQVVVRPRDGDLEERGDLQNRVHLRCEQADYQGW